MRAALCLLSLVIFGCSASSASMRNPASASPGDSYKPLFADENVSLWATKRAERGSEALSLVRLSTKEPANAAEKFSLSIKWFSQNLIPKYQFYAEHEVVNATALSDSTFLVYVTEFSRMGDTAEDMFKFSYLLKLDSQLKPDPAFGAAGTFKLESTKTKWNKRTILSLKEIEGGNVLGVEKRCVRDGDPEYNTPCKCFGFGFDKKGTPARNLGKEMKCPG